MSLAQLQAAPDRDILLRSGPPGASKSALCHRMLLYALAMDRPAILVVSERSSAAPACLDHRRRTSRVRANETIRIWANEGSVRTELLMARKEEPGCFYTCSFLNGLFSAVKDQQVREVQSIAMGAPYCEREIA